MKEAGGGGEGGLEGRLEYTNAQAIVRRKKAAAGRRRYRARSTIFPRTRGHSAFHGDRPHKPRSAAVSVETPGLPGSSRSQRARQGDGPEAKGPWSAVQGRCRPRSAISS